MAKRAHSPVPWKALLLGGALGYLISVLMAANTEGSGDHLVRQRFLSGSEPLEPEEGHHGEEEEGEGEEEAAILDSAITVIVLILLALTILFESFKEGIEEAADRSMEPVIEGLFGELTVLGFLSVVTFCFTKMGIFEKISERFFEEPEELLEIFEQVHYMLFFIMVFFVINVLVLMHGGKKTSKRWWLYNRACIDPEYMKQLDAVLRSHPDEDNQTSYARYFCGALFPCRDSKHQLRSELQLFRGLRHEFLAERSLNPPFAPSNSEPLDKNFDFGRYLTICQAHSVAHMVHLSNSTWVFLGVVTVAYYVIALLVSTEIEPFAWIWAGTGWLCFVLGTYFDYHMVNLVGCMAARHVPQTENGGEGSALLPHTPSLPQWTSVDLAKYKSERPLLSRCFLPRKSNPTRQDALYWLEKRGPQIYLIIFQIQMVFTSAYVSLLALTLLPYMLRESPQSAIARVVYLFFSLLPVFLLLSEYQVAAANLTMACSVGTHRRPQAITEVTRAGKSEDLIRSVVLMQKLQLAAKTGFVAPSSARSTLSAAELQEAIEDFDRIDESGDGNICSEELANLLKTLNIKYTEETLQAMVNALDTDKNGTICKDEFVEFYRAHVFIELDDAGLRSLGKDMFHQLDLDGSGEITLTELTTALESFDAGLTLEEISEIVNKLDEHDDGTLTEHEFVRLMTVTHRLMFDRTPLPRLE